MKNIFKKKPNVKTENEQKVTDHGVSLSNADNHNQKITTNTIVVEQKIEQPNLGKMTKKQLVDYNLNNQIQYQKLVDENKRLANLIAENARLKKIAQQNSGSKRRSTTTNAGNALIIIDTFIGSEKTQPLQKVSSSLAIRANRRFVKNGQKYITVNKGSFDGIDTEKCFGNIHKLPCGRERMVFVVTPDQLHEIGKFSFGACFNALTTDFSWQYDSNGFKFVNGNFGDLCPENADFFRFGAYPVPFSNSTTKELNACSM